MLAIMRALDEWRHFLEGAPHKVEIWTDHKNLDYFMSAKKLNHWQAEGRWASRMLSVGVQIMVTAWRIIETSHFSLPISLRFMLWEESKWKAKSGNYSNSSRGRHEMANWKTRWVWWLKHWSPLLQNLSDPLNGQKLMGSSTSEARSMFHHLDSRTPWKVEDVGASKPELLVTADVKVHQPVHLHMRSLPLDQGSKTTPDGTSRAASNSWHSVGHSERRFHCWTPAVGRPWRNHGSGGLAHQKEPLPPREHYHHCSRVRQAILQQRVEAPQSSDPSLIWPRSTIHSWIYHGSISVARDQSG